jgi:hypothetical protein
MLAITRKMRPQTGFMAFIPRLLIVVVLMVAQLSTTPKALAQGDDFVMTREIVEGKNGNCKVDEGTVHQTEARFLQTVCEFHRNPAPSNVDELEDRIETLQSLQTQGLSGSKQELAALLEGLGHCQQARLAMARKNSDIAQKNLFCSARESAYAAFRSVRWEFARFAYASDSGRDLLDLVDAVGECQDEGKGPLSSAFNSSCGLSSELSPEKQKSIIDETYTKIEKKYFGGISPITLLFIEKKTLADGVANNSKGKIDKLKQRSDTLAATYSNARTYYDANVVGRLDTIVKNYKESYAISKAILARYDEWQKGLLESGLEQDLVIGGIIPSVKKRLQDKSEQMDTSNGYAGSVNVVVKKLETLLSSKDVNEKAARKMCAMYYCYIAVGPDADSPYRRACNTTQLLKEQKNPLCESTQAKLEADGTSKSVREFCESVNFDVARFGKTGMSFATAAACEVK